MLSTGIPELTVDDMSYLVRAFALDLNDKEASERFQMKVQAALGSWRTSVCYTNTHAHIHMHIHAHAHNLYN